MDECSDPLCGWVVELIDNTNADDCVKWKIASDLLSARSTWRAESVCCFLHASTSRGVLHPLRKHL